MKRNEFEGSGQRPGRPLNWLRALLLLQLLSPHIFAQVIDFEALPDGTPTSDEQVISDQYAAYGVTFELLDPGTGETVGLPQIAKAGLPQTAFIGCYDQDLPYLGQGLGNTFLTDNTSIGISTDLLIRYSPPVSQTSGVIIDIDCRIDGASTCEQWTITARDASDAVLDTVVLDGPPGSLVPECLEPESGPGNSVAFTWSFDLPGQQITTVLLEYTGAAGNVGLAFDNFSIALSPGPPEVTISGPQNESCAGQTVELLAEVSRGYAPYAYQWQEEVTPGTWTDLGTDPVQLVSPTVSTSYRVRVTDGEAQEATSDTHSVTVVSGAGEPACDGRLLVCSAQGDRVLRYDPVTMSFVDTFVPVGSGGLDGPSGIDFGHDGYLYVVSQQTHSVLRYDGETGDFDSIFVPSRSGGLYWPVGLEIGFDGHLYISSSDTNSVKKYDGVTGAYLGDFVTAGSGGLNNPTGLTFGPDGHLYVSGRLNNAVKQYGERSGEFIDGFPVGNGLDFPSFMTYTQYCGDSVCDLGIGEHGCNCAGDCGSPHGSELVCDDGLDDDCDGPVDCADHDCDAEIPCSPAGAVPDGRWVPGTMLTVEKATEDEITLQWDSSCRSGDIDYEVYEGWIGAFSSHLPVTCSSSSSLSWTFEPENGNTYYLVVPHNGFNEGSYGRNSEGSERSQSRSACLARIIGDCD